MTDFKQMAVESGGNFFFLISVIIKDKKKFITKIITRNLKCFILAWSPENVKKKLTEQRIRF